MSINMILSTNVFRACLTQLTNFDSFLHYKNDFEQSKRNLYIMCVLNLRGDRRI